MKYLVLITLLFAGMVSAQTQYKPDFSPADGSEIHAEVGVTNSSMGGDYQFGVEEQVQATVFGDMHFSHATVTWISSAPSNITINPPDPSDNPNYPPPPSGPNNLHHPYKTGAVGGVPQPGTEGTYTFEIEWFWYDTIGVGAGGSTASEVRTYTLIIHPSGYTGVRGWGTNSNSSSSSSGGGGGDDDSSGCAGTLGDSYALIPVLFLLLIAGLWAVVSRTWRDSHEGLKSSSVRVREHPSQTRTQAHAQELAQEEKEGQVLEERGQ